MASLNSFDRCLFCAHCCAMFETDNGILSIECMYRPDGICLPDGSVGLDECYKALIEDHACIV